MVWYAGSGRAGYDYPGPWTHQHEVQIASPDGVLGDQSQPGEASPGTFMPLEEMKDVSVEVDIEW